jgi:hypothetical protein
MAFAVPGCLSECLRALRHLLVSEQRDHREQSQQSAGALLWIALWDQCLCVSNPKR